jgi:hypothetical protein
MAGLSDAIRIRLDLAPPAASPRTTARSGIHPHHRRHHIDGAMNLELNYRTKKPPPLRPY